MYDIFLSDIWSWTKRPRRDDIFSLIYIYIQIKSIMYTCIIYLTDTSKTSGYNRDHDSYTTLRHVRNML